MYCGLKKNNVLNDKPIFDNLGNRNKNKLQIIEVKGK